MLERSTRKRESKSPSAEEMELSSKVQEKEEILMGYLSPIESSVMTFQNVLVWDNPQHSVILFIVVHVLFW